MIYFLFLIGVSSWEIDNSGVAFEDQNYSILIKATKENLATYTIPAATVKIKDADDPSEGPFSIVRSTLTSIIFENGSNMTQLGIYCFSDLLIENIDLSPCSKLKELSYGCFKQCSRLNSIIFPPNLKLIHCGALSSMSKIYRFDFPPSLEEIEGYHPIYGLTTDNNPKLSLVTWGKDSKLQILGQTMFGYCNVSEIYITKNLRSIGIHCYCMCPIEKITIESDKYFSTDGKILYNSEGDTVIIVPYSTEEGLKIREGVKQLAGGCFSYFPRTAVLLPSTLEIICSQCFYGSKIHTISIPQNVHSIQGSSFVGCSLLEEINLNCSITNIQTSTFQNCRSLKRILIPSKVKTISTNSFKGCSSLSYVYIPKSVDNIHSCAFAGVNPNIIIEFEKDSPLKLENNILYNANYTNLISYIGEETKFDVVIRSSVIKIVGGAFSDKAITSLKFENESKLETIEEIAFKGGLLKTLIFPPFLRTIGNMAFSNCRNIESIEFGSNTFSIESSAFSYCVSLTKAVFPSSLVSIDERAFYSCTNLKSIEFGDDSDSLLSSIGESAFELSGIHELEFPKSLSHIGANAFKGSDIFSVSFPLKTSLQKIEKEAFRGCPKLKLISFGGVEEIGENCFEDCTSLSDLMLGRKVITIKTSAFKGCSCLESITLSGSSSLTTIEQFAFEDCPKLIRFVLSDGANFATDPKLEDAILYDLEKTKIIIFLPAAPIRKIIVPPSVEKISSYSFSSASFLEEIYIGDGSLRSIGFSAFSGCLRLCKLRLPPSIEEIQSFAFENCISLKCGCIDYTDINGIRKKLESAGVQPDALSSCPTVIFTEFRDSECNLVFMAQVLDDAKNK